MVCIHNQPLQGSVSYQQLEWGAQQALEILLQNNFMFQEKKTKNTGYKV